MRSYAPLFFWYTVVVCVIVLILFVLVHVYSLLATAYIVYCYTNIEKTKISEI